MASQQDQYDLLREAIELARTGERARARALLEQVIRADEYNETAWMWMASVAETIAQRRESLEIVLEINPDNDDARRALERLGGPSRAERKARQSAWLADRVGGEAAEEREFQPIAQRPPDPGPPPAPPEPTPEELQAERARRLIEMARREQPPQPETPPEPITAEAVEYYDFASETRRRWLRRIALALGGLVAVGIVTGLIIVAAPILSEALKPPPAPPTATPGLATALALAASPTPTATLPPTGVVIPLPAAVEETPIPPTWTPSPTPTATITPRATETPLPPGRYTLLFSSRREGDTYSNLYTVRGDGMGERRLTDDTANAFYPAVAPNGLNTAYVSLGAGENAAPELALYPLGDLPPIPTGDSGAEGEAPAGFTPQVIAGLGGTRMSRPSWSPDGARLAFSSDADGDEDVYIVNADGSGLANLTNNRDIVDRDPAWSPDGSAIVFASDRDGRGETELYRMNANGTDTVRLTDSANSSYCPDWSPDGRFVVFVSDRDRDADLYVMNADGSDEHLLTRDDGGAEDHDPAWSPDGRWIAFSSNREGDYFQLYLIDPAGGAVLRTTRSTADDAEPAWMGG